MAQRSAGDPLVGHNHGSEERLDETSVASQIRAREAAIAREADSENVSPSQSPTGSTNPDTITPTAARRVRGPIFTTVARKSPDAPRAARPQQGLQAGNLNDMFSWDHGQLAEHLMAREAGEQCSEIANSLNWMVLPSGSSYPTAVASPDPTLPSASTGLLATTLQSGSSHASASTSSSPSSGTGHAWPLQSTAITV